MWTIEIIFPCCYGFHEVRLLFYSSLYLFIALSIWSSPFFFTIATFNTFHPSSIFLIAHVCELYKTPFNRKHLAKIFRCSFVSNLVCCNPLLHFLMLLFQLYFFHISSVQLPLQVTKLLKNLNYFTCFSANLMWNFTNFWSFIS